MEQKKRRRINFFDLLFVVIILAVAVAAYFLSHGSDTQGGKTVTRSYTLELTNLQENMAEYVAVGDTVTDNVRNYDLGTVTEVQVQPCETTVVDEEAGVVRQATLDGYITLVLTITVDTVETDSQITTDSGYTLRTGTAVSCSVGSLTASGYILTIER